MTKPKLKRIIKLADRILNMKGDPEYLFDMNCVHHKDREIGKTRICIAGMTILMFGSEAEKAELGNMFDAAVDIGHRLLGIDKEKFHDLYSQYDIGRKEAARKLLALAIEHDSE